MRLARFFLFLQLALLFTQSAQSATTIPILYRDGLIWLKVNVAGKPEPLNFLLDSGAGRSVIDLSAARRSGIKLGQAESVQGVNGGALAYSVDGFNARAGNVQVVSSLLAIDLSGPSRSCHQHIDGLLGADFFQNRIVQIDFMANKVELLERGELNLNGGDAVPLEMRNDTFCARISVNGNSPDWLRLDTGCSTPLEWVVTGENAKKLGMTTIGFHSGPIHEFHTDVQIGAEHIAGVKTGLHTAQMFSGESGLIGNGLLSRFVVTIDTSKRRCSLVSR